MANHLLRDWRTAATVAISVADWKTGGGVEIAVGHDVTLHYSVARSEGALEASDFADSSYDRGHPLSVVVGAGELAPGLDDALVGQRDGGTRRIFVRRPGDPVDKVVLVLDIFVVSVVDSPATEAWRLFDAVAVER
ncbi:MAG: FKBP-type peptidyl-prolyl cis-trans isomerase [Solirubrobacterales bacterium]